MRRPRARFLTMDLWLAVAAALAICSSAGMGFENFAGLASVPVRISYESTSPITLHEPVIVKFSVNNGLAERINLDLGTERKTHFVARLTKPNGSIVQLQWPEEAGFRANGRISVSPSRVFSQPLLLSELYYFDEPGDYQIQMRLTSPIQRVDGSKVTTPMTGIVRIRILPRDLATLSHLCERLARTAERRSSFAESADAAVTLSYVIDPVTVPYLKRVVAIGDTWVNQIAIPGLARIADPDAIEALRLAAESGNEATKGLAKYLLEKIQRGERDPLIRGAVDKVN